MTLHPYEYAVLRAVPRADRGEFVNVGVILHCQEADWLACTHHVDPARLRAIDHEVDVHAVRAALAAIEAVCAGDPSAGDAAVQALGVRFRWLTAPRSTVVQPGPVHAGLTDDPAAQLAHLMARQVR